MESIVIISLAIITALLTTAQVKKIALKYGIGSLPDNRKIHVGFVPYLGGLGIYLGGLVGLMVAVLWKEYYLQTFTLKYAAIIFGATLMLVTGALDDAHGLPATQKFIIQLIASTIVIFSGCRIDTIINPFGDPVQLGIFAIPITYLWLMGVTNAINLLDGLDGLAIGVTTIVAGTFLVVTYLVSRVDYARYLMFPYIANGGDLTVILGALVGAGLGFLWFNSHPAEVFMGDTGSLLLGGMLGTIALLVKQELLLVIVGGIFVIEALSVILQVGSYRLRGRRVFLMSPLHYHYQKKGLAESKIIARFWIVAALLALVGLASLKLR